MSLALHKIIISLYKIISEHSFSFNSGILSIKANEIDFDEVIEKSLTKIINDPINNLDVGIETLGNKVTRIAADLINYPGMEQKHFLVDTILKTMSARDLAKESDLQLLMSDVHRLTLNNDIKSIFDDFADTKSDEFRYVYHSLCMNIMREIMEMENSKASNKPAAIVEKPLRKDEQEVIQYVAGFIIYSLRRKFVTLSKSRVVKTRVTATSALAFLETLHGKFDSNLDKNRFLDFRREWTVLVNRGGLIEVNTDFFILIRRIEGTI